MTSRRVLSISLVAWAAATAIAAPSVQAMPMFARKYKMDCSGCHAPVAPRLNDVGYKFRRAGFRMPEQIGQEEVADFTLGDYFSGRIQTEYRLSRERQEGETEGAPARTTTQSRFEGQEITLYPVTGSFEKYFASETEIGLGPGESPEIENAYVRAVWGKQNAWLQARTGIFHPIEGFGASDRPIGLTRPLFESLAPAQTQDSFARITDLDRIGLEVGAQWRNTSFNVAVLNQLQLLTEEGELGVAGTTRSAFNHKDVLLSANQIIGTRGGVGAYWAHGSIQLPVDPEGFATGANPATWRNRYDRFAVFGTVGKGRFTGLVGGALGLDHDRDPMTGALSTFRSLGGFVEGDVALGAHTASYLRLDYFDPSRSRKGDDTAGVTVGTSIYTAALFLIPELRYLRQPLGDGTQNSLAFTIRAVVIY